MDRLLDRREGFALGLGSDRQVVQLRGGEERLEPVVVGRGDGVELVIVAPGASDRQSQEHRADRAGDLGELRLPLDLGDDVAADDLARTAPAESRGDQGVAIAGLDVVPGELEHEEAIVGEIGVQRLDDPVAIAPGVGRSASSSKPLESA